MFSVYTGNAQSSCLVVGAVASCFTHAGLPHWSFDPRNWWRRSVSSPPQVGYRQVGVSVSDPLVTGAPDMQSWSQVTDDNALYTEIKQLRSLAMNPIWQMRPKPYVSRFESLNVLTLKAYKNVLPSSQILRLKMHQIYFPQTQLTLPKPSS